VCHPLPAAGAVALVALAACGSGSSRPPAAGPTTSSAPPAATITTFGGTPGAAQAAACTEDARAVQQASDLYAASRGGPAPSLDALVAAGVLRAAPSTTHGYVIRYDGASGHVSAEGACTIP
jgi:hypothetical protein